MRHLPAVAILAALLALVSSAAHAQGKRPQVRISGGDFTPFYGAKGDKVHIDAFYMDVYPVTNAEFLAFVARHPRWRRDEIPPLFADADYLNHWSGSVDLGANAPMAAPVTNVSWFAAKAFCGSRGMRLPRQDEWEYVARADERRRDAFTDKAFTKRILGWYSRPVKLPLPAIGQTYKNAWGVWDMHGLVWEWVSDFNAALTTGNSRKDQGGFDPKLFCAAGSIGTIDPSNYAAFMRYAMLGSVKARYAVQTMGFRCVSDAR